MKKVISVLLACLAFTVLTLVSCDALAGPSAPGVPDGPGGGPSAPGSSGSRTDSAIHGTWRGNEYDEIIITFRSDGTFETAEYDPSSRSSYPQRRGTYSTGGGSLTVTITHLYFDYGDAYVYNTTQGWKDRSQLTEIYRRNGEPEWWIEEIIDDFISETMRYYISGNTLTFYYNGGYSDTFTRM